ncbi:hypothetical protein BT63DRAFT_419475 [Microthyrium microscopicum]|uniref:DUF4336 domain-containing protein n=1 Tax=Microthyrium microscopicum TaxID=703497 RepID=A0A6A6URY4_9PEZI|nr:hypothetical protein BT63DRAFT_419475 [Microthyrium microscopicum]
MSPLSPTNPEEVMVIRKINQFITTLSLPFYRFGRIRVGGRGTLVRLSSGGVAVFSPVALTPAVKQELASMGELKYIAALDIEHHIFLGPWHEAFPNAKVLGPAGLIEKRTKQNDAAVPFFKVFEPNGPTSVDADFDADFEAEFVYGHMNKELVFLHKPSKTLIEADLMFNLPATEQFSKSGEAADQGFLTKQFIKLQNTKGDATGQKRTIWYGTSAGDRPAFNKSVARVAGWDFDKIVPCHGDVIETDAKSVFERVFGWHLDAFKKETAAAVPAATKST